MFATMMLGNGTTRKYQFDNWGQLTTQIEFSGATPVCTIVDGYDPVGNRLTRNLDGNPVSWSYDDLYRLTGKQKAGQVCTYTLDGVGNLKTMWEGGNFPKTFTHDPADKIVTMIEGSNLTTYTWTGYGALSSEITGTATTNYGYNGQDQLALVTPPGDGFPTTYAFDGDGLRRSIQTTNVNQDPPTLDITTVVWDGSDYLLLNGPISDAVVLTLGGEIVSSGSFDLLPDSLGSVIGDIRSGQEPRVPFSYWPYGTMLLSVVQPSFPFLFVGSLGYYYDSSDRDYVRARELMKKLGRWMQTDALSPSARAYHFQAGPLSGPPNSRLRSSHKSKQCYVRECSLYDDKPVLLYNFPAHSWVCARSPYSSCTGGLPGNIGKSERNYGCETGWIDNQGDRDWVECRDISTDCGVAALACRCITRTLRLPAFGGSGKPPDYVVPTHVCYRFEFHVAKCVCGTHIEPVDESLCYQKFNQTKEIVM
ncbi:MAG: hypothetical protein HND43_07205 [Armatimonadetes bacterium]|nr:hypothetical protein [Armatimonadota bacterium]NOG39166.1 hypothetical protein [Armatimonadota bacterium]GIK32353.1 MAG: hypothetical protein BroJett009_13450 [Armatimonadota bacterium]